MQSKHNAIFALAYGLFVGLGIGQATTKPMIFWLDNMGSVYASNSDGSNRKILASGNAQGLIGCDGIAVDTAAGKVYWSNMGVGATGSIQRANLDGSQLEYVVKPGETHTPKQIKLDRVNRKIYWCDRDGFKIQRSNLDGTANEILVAGLQNPVGMELDIAKGFFYWSDKNAGTIMRAHFVMPPGQSASNRRDLDTLIKGLPMPIDLALDIPSGQIYWTDRQAGTVQRAYIEIPAGQSSGNRTDIKILISHLATPIGISLDRDGGKIYYTELDGGVGRSNLDGTNLQPLCPRLGTSLFCGIDFVQVTVIGTGIRVSSQEWMDPRAIRNAGMGPVAEWESNLKLNPVDAVGRKNLRTFHGSSTLQFMNPVSK